MWKTASIFFRNPTTLMYLMGISREIRIAHTSVKANLKILVHEKIITEEIEKRGKRRFPAYRANINSQEYRKYKRIYNFSSIIESVEKIKSMPCGAVLLPLFMNSHALKNLFIKRL